VGHPAWSDEPCNGGLVARHNPVRSDGARCCWRTSKEEVALLGPEKNNALSIGYCSKYDTGNVEYID
jgi:hypothetical protein